MSLPVPSYEELSYDWGSSALPSSFRGVVDETIRDGLQVPFAPALSLEQKKCLIGLSGDSKVSDILIGTVGAADNDGDLVPLIEFSANVIQPWVLCRLRETDIQQLINIQDRAGVSVGLNLFIALSDLRRYVEGWDLEQIFSELESCLSLGGRHFSQIRVAFEDATRTHPETLARAQQIVIYGGATRLTIADTAGIATPLTVRRLFEFLKRERLTLKETKCALEWHGHNDRGLGIANTLESIQCGASYVHGTMMGVGERNGNAGLEVILLNLSLELKDRFNWAALRVYHDACKDLFADVLAESYPYFGENTFVTATGTHGAAIKKALDLHRPDLAARLYSPPSVLTGSCEPTILLSPLSGRRAVEALLYELGTAPDVALISELLSLARSENRTLSKNEVLDFLCARASSSILSG